MCFKTTKSARVKIAKEDIVCWKALFKKNKSSVCQEYRYIPMVAQPKVTLCKTDWEDRIVAIFEGYHSCKTKEEALTWASPEIDSAYRFIIPKGTKYYSNETEYVSETIMLVE